MILLDFLFNICYAPFLKVKQNGRLAALIWLSPSLTFTFMGILIWLSYFLFGIRVFSHLSAVVSSLISFLIFIAIYLLLDQTYLKKNRDAGAIRFPLLYGLLLPVLVIGSVVFFSLAIYNFG